MIGVYSVEAVADYGLLLTFNSGDLMPMVKNTANRLANFTPIAIMAEDKQLLFIGESAKYKTFADVITAVKGGAKVVIGGSKGDDVATYELLIKELGLSENQLAFITTLILLLPVADGTQHQLTQRYCGMFWVMLQLSQYFFNFLTTDEVSQQTHFARRGGIISQFSYCFHCN